MISPFWSCLSRWISWTTWISFACQNEMLCSIILDVSLVAGEETFLVKISRRAPTVLRRFRTTRKRADINTIQLRNSIWTDLFNLILKILEPLNWNVCWFIGKEGHYQVILKKVELPIVPRKECQDKLRETRLGKYFRLHETFICAGGEAGKDTCKVN